ncbi:hypothetical protein BE20_24830 [Sorangium cellulosum]|uniref:Uncharacterized protein n=1 Tax=Sorangium cellulosum TaxID=56 RepID=A0A150S5L4_SORCE|nr:hypothetical protein BE20_24830 [Sorangium cellulosum]KYF89293.1 hypothetical protein BE18_22940 [Sorangium cellulosum]
MQPFSYSHEVRLRMEDLLLQGVDAAGQPGRLGEDPDQKADGCRGRREADGADHDLHSITRFSG